MSPDRIREITLDMRKSAVNLYSLLENLLEWSRMQRGNIEFSPVEFNLDEKVRECVDLVIGPALKKNIHIQIEIPQDLIINADFHMFCTIIRNLVSNAIKFTERGGKIMISASPDSGNLTEILISDTGIGMDLKMLGNLFTINDEIRRKGTEGEPSSGLGLLLCHEFVEKHGGKISVDSEVGKGSTFKIVL
jgi:signal transduction histidine kinase